MLESDPLDVKLDVDGDLDVDPVLGITFVAGLPGIAQLCRIAIRLFLAEWFLDLQRGVPWYQEILAEKFDADLIRSRLITALLRVPGVTGVVSLIPIFNAQTRRVSVTYSVSTGFGDTEPDTLTVGGSSG